MTDEQDNFPRPPGALKQTSFSRSTLYRKIEQGCLSRQINRSERCVAWRQSDNREWQHNPILYEQSRN